MHELPDTRIDVTCFGLKARIRLFHLHHRIRLRLCTMKFEVLVVFALAAGVYGKNYTVLIFGDSWGDVGPT